MTEQKRASPHPRKEETMVGDFIGDKAAITQSEPMDKMIEEVKKILDGNLVFHSIRGGIGVFGLKKNLATIAKEVCQLFPKMEDNPNGYEPEPACSHSETYEVNEFTFAETGFTHKCATCGMLLLKPDAKLKGGCPSLRGNGESKENGYKREVSQEGS